MQRFPRYFWQLALLAAPVCCANASDGSPSPTPDNYTDDERAHWSYQVPIRPQIPGFADPEARRWIRNPVDAFVLSRLHHAGLQPAPEADRYALIRRLSFDLTGLPPTPEEVAEFAGDHAPHAYERLVERLLASSQYGARWGQHWLDVIRFAESEGFEYDLHHQYAWRFRDYVIRAFNADMPYDRFIREQIAGDELADSGEIGKVAARDALIASGFHRLGPVRRNAGNPEVSFSRNEVLTEMTDAVGTVFLGSTISCARCHDHMYDAIRQADYYRLQAFFATTHPFDAPLASTDQHQHWKAQFDKINVQIEQFKAELANAAGPAEDELRKQLAALEAELPAPLPTLFAVRNDDAKYTPIHLLHRGDELRKGARVGMRIPGVFVTSGTAEFPPQMPRPRTRLAEWIASADNPLTARVMVNRIWQGHFGRGLVTTANDFGVNGELPSHPQLLDYLAVEFLRSGWSIKTLHRLIVTSSTYRQAFRTPHESVAMKHDPGNRLLWRFPRRRLSAEEIRDAMLSVSGELHLHAGGPSVMVPVDEELVQLLYKPSQWQVTPDPRQHNRRSIYLFAKRNLPLPFMEVFDKPTLQTSCHRRETSTHAPQALELLNGRLSNRLADAFAARLAEEAGHDPAWQVDLAFRLTTGRAATAAQQELAIEFVKTAPLREFALAMMNLNAFLYVD